jgi:hypothetical protein
MAISNFLQTVGVDKVEADEAKGTLTVTGSADPYEIIVHARKAIKYAEVVSIGPPPDPTKDKKPDEKKPDEKKPDPKVEVCIPYMPHGCHVCERVGVVHVDRWDEPNSSCSIL